MSPPNVLRRDEELEIAAGRNCLVGSNAQYLCGICRPLDAIAGKIPRVRRLLDGGQDRKDVESASRRGGRRCGFALIDLKKRRWRLRPGRKALSGSLCD